MNARFRAAIWCGSICVASGSTVWSMAYAQVQNVTTLGTVTVHGEPLQTALPPGSTVTDRLELQKLSVNDWSDFSRRAEPGVNFNRHNKSINIRGTDADRVVTRIDGIRIPWLTDGARGVKGGLNSVAFGSLSSIDVIRGAGSNQSGALTGAIDLHTLSPSDILKAKDNFGIVMNTGYDSADYSWRADTTLAGRIQPGTRWLVHLGTRRGDELRNYGGVKGYGPDRIQTNPQDYEQNNLLVKLDHDLSLEHRLEFSGSRFRHHVDIDNRRDQGAGTNFVIGQNSTTEKIDRDHVVLGYKFESKQEYNALSSGYLKTYWQRVKLESQQNSIRIPDPRGSIIPGNPFNYGYPFGAYGRDNAIEESGFGATTQWNGYFGTASLAHHWTAGADWYGSRTRQDSSGVDNCPAPTPNLPAPFGPRSCDLLHTGQSDMPRVKGQAWSAWVQDEMSWQDGRYAFTPALRFDSYRYQPQHGSAYQNNPNADVTSQSSNSGSRVSPSLLATYKPTDTVLLYASYAYGFKAPNASQLYLNYGAPGTYLNVGNSDLKPETSRGWELGVEAGDSQLKGRLSVFNNRYNDFLDSDYAISPDDSDWNPAWNGQYPMGVTTAVNRSRVRIYGAEASGFWQITPHWYSRAKFAWTRGKDMDAGTALNSVAPLKTSLAIGYDTNNWGAEAMLTAVKRHSRVENSDDFKAPGYGITDLSAWWTPHVIKGLRLQAGVYNVFDKKYWDALNVVRSGRDMAPVGYYTEPGRSFRIALSYAY